MNPMLMSLFSSRLGPVKQMMQAVYDWIHQRQINEATEIRVMQEMFKK